MKKILLPILSAFLLTAPAFAQHGYGTNPELSKKCTRITQAMAQELRVSEMDYIKLKTLNCERLVKTEELMSAYGNNEGLLLEKMQEVERAYEEGIATILSPKQLEAYAGYKKEASATVFVVSTGKK